MMCTYPVSIRNKGQKAECVLSPSAETLLENNFEIVSESAFSAKYSFEKIAN